MKAAQFQLGKRFLTRGLPLIIAMMLLGCVRNAFGQWASPSPNPDNNIYYNAGNVGIGTTTPVAALDVNGIVAARTRLWMSGLDLLIWGSPASGMNRVLLSGAPNIESQSANGLEVGTSGTAPIVLYTGSTERFRIQSNGNVGIGTANPNGGHLHVSGATTGSQIYALSTSSTGSNYGIDSEATGSNAESNVGGFFLASGGSSNKGIYINGVASGSNNYALYSDAAAKSYFAGNVGIGTTSPGQKLEVFGTNGLPSTSSTTSVDGILRLQPSGGTSATFDLGMSSNPVLAWLQSRSNENFSFNFPLALNPNGGNVGIGTTSPGVPLEVVKSTAGAQDLITIDNPNGSNGAGVNTGLRFKNATNQMALIYTERDNNNLSIQNLQPGSDIRFLDSATQGSGELVRIQGSTGNVGIGTTSPAQKLSVAGNINVTATATEAGDITVAGTVHAKYQDVAEWVPSSEQLAAGTVVVLDSTKSNQVTSSSTSYDTRVAGVISEQPGIALGEKSDSKVLVATTGRVRVKVDASKGPIHIGDLLVTSDIPGVAMKSEAVNLGGVQIHRPGTLIGKALEPLEKGSGEILVLLSLQ